MQKIKALLGLFLILAGLAGIGFSLLAILATGSAAKSLNKHSSDILDSTEEGVRFLKTGTEKVDALLDDTRTRVELLDKTLDELEKKVNDKNSDTTLLNTLDENIAYKLQRAQASVASLQTTLEGLNNTLTLFHSIPGVVRPEEEKHERNASEARELSQTLLEASEVLEQISTFLNEVLTKRDVTAKSLRKIRELVDEIRSKLNEADSRVEDFDTRLSVTEERISASKEELPRWIDRGYVLVIIFFICFAFTQVGLMMQAACLFRKS